METKKATIKYIDVLGRAALLTEDNKALVLKIPDGRLANRGDVVTIERLADLKRDSDWRVV